MGRETLRELGNEHYKAGQFKDAETLYSQAIQQNPTDPKLFSNRALTRIKLQDWEGAEYDSRKAIEIYGERSTSAMKSYYYLAQALLAQRHTTEALETARFAYKICLETKDSSSEVLSAFILKTKQAVWQSRETARLRALNETLGTIEDLLDQQLERDLEDVDYRYETGAVGDAGRVEERQILHSEADERRRIVRSAFKDASNPETGERAVPDYLIDTITFEVMHDPVITPSGASYERTSILKHLRAHGVDPLSRQPMTERELIPNLALKQCCSEFLEANGWAVDY